MKIAIVGKTDRAKAWEKHLRQLSAVEEVIISSSLISDNVDGYILIDESINNLHLLHDAIRAGYPAYLISRLPLDQPMIEKIYYASEEAKVNVQFSHWPSHAPSTQWMKQQIQKPELIQVKKEMSINNYSNSNRSFEQHWMDEVAFVVRYFNTGLQSLHAKPLRADTLWVGMQLFFYFDDGGVASIQFSTIAKQDLHQRIIGSGQIIIDSDVNNHKVRMITLNDSGNTDIREKSFDVSKTAELSVLNFIKSIQLNRRSEFSSYDALQTVKVYEKIQAYLNRFK